MTPGPRAPLLLLLAGLALTLLLHAPLLGGAFLSDDYSVLWDMAEWTRRDGSPWPGALAKFVEPLGSHSHYYRPLGLLSFASDYALAGIEPLPWHLGNLLLHLCNGALLGMLVRQLAGSKGGFAAALACTLLWLSPLAPEVSVWISGRYDALATAAMLAASIAHRAARGLDRWRALSLLAFALALCAKEAAMLLPGWLLLLSLLDPRAPPQRLPARALRILRECAPALLLFALYLGWRAWLFGAALQVYADAPPLASLLDFGVLLRLAALASILPNALPGVPVALWLLVAGGLALLLGAGAWLADRQGRLVQLLCALATVLSIAALLPHVAGATGHGEGGRLLYLAAAWLAAWTALAVAALPRRAGVVAASVALVLGSAWAQAQLLRQWHAAGTAMQGVLSATATYAARADGQTLGLLLLPDHHGPVPFARNAQGGVVSPPHHPHGLLDRVVPLLPGQFAEWQQHIADGLPARLKGLQPGTPVAIELLCLDRDAVELVALGAYQPGMQLDGFWGTAIAASRCAPFYRDAGWLPPLEATARGATIHHTRGL